VNLQRPYTRVDGGIDTLDLLVDLLVDLVVGPDLSWSWKDEDDYAKGRRSGVITDDDHRHVTAAREQAVAMIEDREAPFGDRPPTWRPDDAWLLPHLPVGPADAWRSGRCPSLGC
jgi:predicted RNA-binding protein associated with RNAse of E/G family